MKEKVGYIAGVAKDVFATKEGHQMLLCGFVVFLFVWMVWPKARPEQATDLLVAHGYTSIKIDGSAIFGCGKGDIYRTRFSAVSPAGVYIQGIVCEGITKGETIRFN